MKRPLTHLMELCIISLLFLSCASPINYHFQTKGRKVYTGLENFVHGQAQKYRGKKAALVTNHSGYDYNLQQNLPLLRDQGIVIPLVLAPEHGIYGYNDDIDYQYYWRDEALGVEVYNLYKTDRSTLEYLLRSVDIVIFDIQDMGMRCYTYITNLKEIMDALNGMATELIVLDRPNPLSFLGVDGAYPEPGLASQYVTAFPAPFLYGMTIGESAYYYRGEFAPDVRLTVVGMSGYGRGMLYYETGLPWIPPSPNLPTYESSIVYAAVVLMEGVNLSLGRGTPKPFEYIGAPWIEPVAFSKMLEDLKLKNFKFKPVYFKPSYSKYAGALCGGAQIFYTSGRFSPTETAYHIIAAIMKNYPKAQWVSYGHSYNVDALAGTEKFRLSIKAGKAYEEYHKEIITGVRDYEKKMKKYLLY